MKVILWTLTVLSSISLVLVLGVVIVKHIEFTQNCTGHLKLAADANTIDLAKSEMKKALDYIEAKNYTSGYTSVLWKTEDENIGFWYENLKAAYNELCNVPESSSLLERTNILMKLRETIADSGGEGGLSITCPQGLSRYPNNAGYGWWAFLSLTLLMVFLIVDGIVWVS